MLAGTSHTMVSVVWRVSLAIACPHINPRSGGSVCLGIVYAHLQPTHRSPISLLCDFDLGLGAAESLENSQLREAVLI